MKKFSVSVEEKISFLQDKFPPDWRAMNPADAGRNVDEAIRVASERINFIRNIPDSEVTFENTVRAYDRSTLELDRVWNWIEHLQSVSDSPQLRAAIEEQTDKVVNFYTSIEVDSVLYGKMKHFSALQEAENLPPHAKKLLEETLLDFRFGGADLPDDKKAELAKIEAALSSKTRKFSENVLDATHSFEMHITDPAELSGLPESAIDIASKKALLKGKDGWIFTLEQPSYVPFMTYSENAPRREEMWRAFSSVGAEGKFSNWELMRRIVELRAKKARLLGYENFADMVLSRRMAKNGRTADAFISKLHDRLKSCFDSEWKELSDFAQSLSMTENGLIRPFDCAYLSEKLRRRKYDFDGELLRPYFPLGDVVDGMFKICQKLFGIRIQRRSGPAEAWNDAVGAYELFDSSGKLLGIFYADFFPRPGKRSGAWMNLLAPALDGRPALGVIAANVAEPTAEKPALLNHDEVQTLFHEFGHLIHFFMMDSEEIGLRDVAWDFVELPSQIMENWTLYKQCLDLFARNYKDASPIPEDLFARFDRARKFMGATAAMRQLSFAHIDLAIHLNPSKFLSGDFERVARAELEGYTHKYSREVPTILPRFTHLFGDSVGYAAGYYSYKWAEALDADAFTRFQKEGILNGQTGAEFAEKILRVGSSVPPDVAFRNFMGRDPDVEALIQRTVQQ